MSRKKDKTPIVKVLASAVFLKYQGVCVGLVLMSEVGSHYITLDILKFIMQMRLASNTA